MTELMPEKLFPRFILKDKNGYAMACAVKAALEYADERLRRGLKVLLDVSEMPEWRLDEMAKELGCLYDYSADVEVKRRWIAEAEPLFAAHGTPKAIYNYLEGFFDEVEVEEYWQYDGEPFHFRVTVSGEWTAEAEAWARMAIERSRNVRSVLDDFSAGSGAGIQVHGEAAVLGRIRYERAGTMVSGAPLV